MREPPQDARDRAAAFPCVRAEVPVQMIAAGAGIIDEVRGSGRV